MEREDDYEPSAFTSKGREVDTWRSPRKIQEEIRLYRRNRFAFYMGLVDIGALDQEEALKQLREELAEDDGQA